MVNKKEVSRRIPQMGIGNFTYLQKVVWSNFRHILGGFNVMAANWSQSKKMCKYL